jgi:LmbE family N-acetylglucosaminyl deacetylase
MIYGKTARGSISMEPLKLMAVFAHPDDEAFGMGGTLTKYADGGHDVHLVTATRGEAGLIAEAEMATFANLPEVREQELRCACNIYGINPPRFLDYQDGQLTTVHQGQAVGKLVRILRQIRPDVVVTFGPDGVYGHYDHIAVHRWTTIAIKLAADRSCFPDVLPEQCTVHQVKKLYHKVISDEQVDGLTNGDPLAGIMMDGVPFPFVGYPPDQITTVIDVEDYAAAKLQGIRCHGTQVGRRDIFGRPDDEIIQQPWFRDEEFLLAASTVGRPEDTEDDLFWGLR